MGLPLAAPLWQSRNSDDKRFISAEIGVKVEKLSDVVHSWVLFAPQTVIKIPTASANVAAVFRFDWGPACKGTFEKQRSSLHEPTAAFRRGLKVVSMDLVFSR